MWKTISAIIDRLFSIAGAFIFCQFPQFVQQYMLLLSGHISESAQYLGIIADNAKLSNKSVPEYIQKFLSQSDPDFIHQGLMLQKIQMRYEELTQSFTSIHHATVWTKPFVFMANTQKDILTETIHAYTPGLPFTLEALVYAVIGLLVGMCVYKGLYKLGKMIFSSKKPKTPQA